MAEDIVKNIPKVLINQRQNLGLIAPLDTPFTIEIGVSSYCNLKCKFCFHYDNKIEKKNMSFELFKKIINDLKCFPQKLKKLKFCGYGENLIHPQFIDMLKFTKESGIAEFIELTTNGVLLTPELSENLVNNGLNQINISIESVNFQGYLETSGRAVDVNALADNIKYLFDYKNKMSVNLLVYTKIIDKTLKNEEEKKLFFEMFKDISDYLFVEQMIDMWLAPDNLMIKGLGDIKNVYGLPVKNNKVCSFLFTRFIIHSDGVCVPCCSDWSKKCTIGDLKIERAIDIWNGDKLRQMRIAHLHHKKNDIDFCNGCHVYDLNSADNIDGYESEILSRMQIKNVRGRN